MPHSELDIQLEHLLNRLFAADGCGDGTARAESEGVGDDVARAESDGAGEDVGREVSDGFEDGVARAEEDVHLNIAREVLNFTHMFLLQMPESQSSFFSHGSHSFPRKHFFLSASFLGKHTPFLHKRDLHCHLLVHLSQSS